MSTAAARLRGMVVEASCRTEENVPPRYTADSVTAIARTAPLGSGAQAVAWPVVASTAAALARAAVVEASWRTLLNDPPRYTAVGVTAMACTDPFGLASQAVAYPVVGSTAPA